MIILTADRSGGLFPGDDVSIRLFQSLRENGGSNFFVTFEIFGFGWTMNPKQQWRPEDDGTLPLNCHVILILFGTCRLVPYQIPIMDKE